MARPLRIEEPDLWHHIMNRGSSGWSIFPHDDDREFFLQLVNDIRQRWGIVTSALVLMTNHYHLLVHDTQGRLSRAMRHLDGVYTQRFNSRHRRDGSLFRGRYQSRVVQEERYLAEVVRYIHLNPVRAKLVSRAEDYPWSSHRWYLAQERPEWLDVREILGLFGDDDDATRLAFDAFIHEPVPVQTQKQLSRWSPLLGDDRFTESWRSKLKAGRAAGRPQIPDEARLIAWTCDEVIDAVARTFDVPVASIRTGRRGTKNVPRQIALVICIDHTPATSNEVAEAFDIASSGISSIVASYRKRILKDDILVTALERALGSLNIDEAKRD